MSGSVITLQNVGVFFSRRRSSFLRPSNLIWALQDVSLDIQRAETLGIVGRNGSGKSTLLKVLAGTIAPDRGRIVSSAGHISLLSLQLGFLPHLSGRENAVLGGMLLGYARAEIKSKLEEIIAFAEIGEFIDEPIATYSSGMKARLGFSVAYYCAPEVLLIDEALGVGDVGFREKSSNAIRELIRSNKTVVLVSHQAQTIRELCDRAVWIEEGKSRCSGSPSEVTSEYESYVRSLKREQVPQG